MNEKHTDERSSCPFFNRRQFINRVAAWSAGALAAPPVFRFVPQAMAAPAAQPLLAVAKGTDYEAILAMKTMACTGPGAMGGKPANVATDDALILEPDGLGRK